MSNGKQAQMPAQSITSVDGLVQLFSFEPGQRLALDKAYCATSGIAFEPYARAFYVQPDLLINPSSAGATDLVQLISAPAAVGKTRLAQELHRRLHAAERHVLYIPLHRAVIGQHFFTGLIGNLFPEHSRREILEHLLAGRLVLIFDGYDEVSMTSLQLEMNLNFTAEIAAALDEHTVPPANRHPCVVFLFRSVFRHIGIFGPLEGRAQDIQVQFFTPPKRKEFLGTYLQTRGWPAGTSLAPSLLDAFEKQLSVAGKEAAAFFGHAIVLSAFGDYLLSEEEGNAIKLANRLNTTAGDGGTAVRILSKIIESIIQREQGKFPNGHFQSTLPGFDGYPPDLQEQMLQAVAFQLASRKSTAGPVDAALYDLAKARLQAHPAYAKLPAAARDQLESSYVEELVKKVDLHPFLDKKASGERAFRNPIYGEYYLARYLARYPLTKTSELPEVWTSSSYYLAFFLLAELPGRDLGASSLDHPYLILTLLASASSEQESEFVADWNVARGAWRFDVDTDGITVEPFFIASEVLILDLPHGAVLSNFSISAWEKGRPSGAISIRGPEGVDERNSHITIRNGELAASEVEFDSGAVTFARVLVHCEALSLAARTSRLNGVGALELCDEHSRVLNVSDFVRSRWAQEMLAPKDLLNEGPAGFKQLLERVLLWFRRHKRTTYGVYGKRFDTVVRKKGRDAETSKFADFLFERKILSNDGALVVFDQDDLARYGVHYLQQNELEVDPKKSEGLYLAWRAR